MMCAAHSSTSRVLGQARLRLENQLGHKMVKWVRSVELIADYRTVGEGKGGWREDVLHYSQIAPI